MRKGKTSRKIALLMLFFFPLSLFFPNLLKEGEAGEKPFPGKLGGNFRYQQKDLLIPCPGIALSITRTYNSQSSFKGLFGHGWHFEFDQKLVFVPSKNLILVVEMDGTVLTFHFDTKEKIFFNRQAGWQAILKMSNGSFVRTLKGGQKQIFNDKGNLIEISDLNGNKLLVEYSRTNQMQRVINSTGQALHFHYDKKGKIQRIEGTLGLAYTYQADERGDLTHFIDPMGRTTVYRYDNFHNLTEIRYPDGNSKILTYDTNHDLLLKESGPGAYQTSYTYDPDNLYVGITDGNGKTTRIGYSSDFRKKVITDPMGGQTVQEYQEDHLLTLQRDPEGNETRYEYDGHGNLKTFTDPMGFREHFRYHPALDLPITITDKLGQQYELKYDSYGNLISIIDPDKNEIRNIYNKEGNLKEHKDEMGRPTQYQYDSNGFLTKIFDALGTVFEATYNALGQMIKRTYPDGSWISFRYSPGGRITSATDSGNRIFHYRYDSMDRLTAIVDPSGKENRLTYDSRGYVVATHNANGNKNSFDYDPLGNLVQLLDANGNATRFRYDSLNRLIQKTDAGKNQFEYTYDGAGRVVAYKDALGQIVRYRYNRLGQLVEKSYPSGARTKFTFNPTGKITAVQGSNTSLFYTYDRLNRMVSKQDDLLGQTLRYTYNPAGEVVQKIGPGGHIIRYSYDERGRLGTIIDPLGGKTEYQYDGSGRRRLITYPNGISAQLKYDALGRVVSIRHKAVDGGLIASVDYTLDQVDNRVSTRIDEKMVRDYSYDAENQLIRETIGNQIVSYGYDRVGNRTELKGAERSVYEYDNLNRLILAGKKQYTYNANGYLVQKSESKRITRYRYDVEGNLATVELPDGKKHEYEYDALGKRVSWSGPAGKILYFYDREDLLAEFSPDRKLERMYLHGPGIDDLIGFIQGDHLFSVHADALGSVRVIADQRQKILSRYDYNAFGQVKRIQEDISIPFLFIGARYDAGTDLHYMRTRAYDPEIGRFISPDTIGVAGGINLYRYVQNNPLKYVDPYGEIMATLLGAVLGPIVGGGRAYLNNKSGAEIWAATTGGLVSGVILGGAIDITVWTGGGALPLVAASGVGGGVGGLWGSATEQVMGNHYARGQSWDESITNIKNDELADAFAGGAIGGMMGGAATGILAPVAGQTGARGVGIVATEIGLTGILPEVADEVISTTDPGTWGGPRPQERERSALSKGSKEKALADLRSAETMINGARELATDANSKIQEVKNALDSDNRASQADERSKNTMMHVEKTVIPAVNACKGVSPLSDMEAAKNNVLDAVDEVRSSSERVKTLVDQACQTSTLASRENTEAGKNIKIKEAQSLADQSTAIVDTHEGIYERESEKLSEIDAQIEKRKAASDQARGVQGDLNSAMETVEKVQYELTDLMASDGPFISGFFSELETAGTYAQQAQSQKDKALGILNNINMNLLPNIEQPDRDAISSQMSGLISSASMITIPSVESAKTKLIAYQDKVRDLAQAANQAGAKIKDLDQSLKTCMEMSTGEEIHDETWGAVQAVLQYMKDMEGQLVRGNDCVKLDRSSKFDKATGDGGGFQSAGEGTTGSSREQTVSSDGFGPAGMGRTEGGSGVSLFNPATMGMSPGAQLREV